ncbi:MAG: helicase C-terminal domain-containing protein [Brevinema sp.]
MNVSSDELFHLEVCSFIEKTITANKGGEVFFIGFTDDDGLVCRVEPIAFGSEDSVPAPLADGLKGDLVIHNHPSGDLRASNPDVNIASLLATKKLGFYIVDNECTMVNVVYKAKPKVNLSPQEILSIFQKDGVLAEMIGAYEERPEQEQMVQAVVQAINAGEILMAEAGTGTGKSFAYLIPAALWAIQSEKRVFLTTQTINLQNQIAKKDASLVSSLVERLTGMRPKFAVLVGRANYVCPKMVEELLHDHEKTYSLFDNADNAQLMLSNISAWMNGSEEGLKSEFPEAIPSDLWEEINATTPSCPRKECPLYDRCFYYRARMNAEASQVVIGNHALLFAAIDEEQGFLSTIPQFSGLVMDEAHHIENTALRAMAEDFSFGGLSWRLTRLFRRRGARDMGQLPILLSRIALETVPRASELYVEACNAAVDLRNSLGDKEDVIKSLLQDAPPSIELTPQVLQQPVWQEIKSVLDDLFAHVRSLEISLSELNECLAPYTTDEKLRDTLRVVMLHADALSKMRQCFLHVFALEEDPRYAVKQVEIMGRTLRFSAGPAEVGDFLAQHVFRTKEFVVFASATLSANKSFSFFSEGAGLPFVEGERTVNSISLPSPFDYPKQMEMLVLDETKLNPNFQQARRQRYEILSESICLTGGGALVLFTSYKAMDEAFTALKDELYAAGLHPMSQRERSREDLLETMKEKDYAVLFATSSFWEGIDVPGEHLRFVIIDKLPFESPDDPLHRAKSKLIESKGGNPFNQYSLPLAVIRFKQGIGRLIRTKSDRGVLLVMDGRIHSKFYGKAFLEAAGKAPVFRVGPDEIPKRIKNFFKI